MKCLVLMPAWEPTDVFFESFADSQLTYWQPTGVMYVAAALKRAGHEVRFIDGAFHSVDWIVEQALEFEPAFIGIYSNMPMWENARILLERFAESLPKAWLATGGPTAIGLKERIFKETHALHFACTGEGDLITPEFVNALERGEDITRVKGWVIRNKDGSLTNTGMAPLVENLNELPYPARELSEDLHRYIPAPSTYIRLPITTMISSRGCYNRCIYCFHVNEKRKIRYRSASNMIEEIEHCIQEYQVREIRFFDDNFCGDRARVIEFCQLMLDKKLPVKWYCNARVDCVDEDMLRTMKKAGCWCVLFGVESGVQKNLDTLQKNITLDQIRYAISSAKKVGLKVYTPFIFGIPGETYEEGLETINLAIELDAHYVNFHTLAPFPGSELYERVDQYGRIVGHYSDYNFEKAAFVPFTMTREQVQELRKLAFRRFYARPRYIFRRIIEARTKEDIRVLMTGAKSLYHLLFNPNAFQIEH
ncbi:radical SAM protein [bacterium]|nr:radical SAM protein [bacterium]